MSYPVNYKGSVPPRLVCGYDTEDSLLHEVTVDADGFMHTMNLYECIGTGCNTDKVPWSKIGYNPSVGTTEELVWPVGGAYVWPSAEMGMEVVSSSADDDVGGTGVEKVKLTYLDDAFAEHTETISMNGTTVVPTTATDIFRIQNFVVYQTGSGGTSAGNIAIRHLSDTPVYSQIEAGYTRARNLTYTVPAGYYLYITSITLSVNSANKGVRVTTRANYDGSRPTELLTFFMPYTEFAVPNGYAYRPLEFPTKFPEGVRIMVTAKSDQDGAIVAMALRGWLEPS